MQVLPYYSNYLQLYYAFFTLFRQLQRLALLARGRGLDNIIIARFPKAGINLI